MGTALCALLGLMQLRVDRATGRPSGYQLLWVVGVIWTLGRFLRYTLQLADANVTSIHLAEALAWSCTIIGPVAIGRFLQARIGLTTRSSRVFVMFTGAVSLMNASLFVWAAATHALDLDASWYPETSFYVALVVTAIALVLYRVDRPAIDIEHGQRWFGRGALVLAVVQITAAWLSQLSSRLPADVRVAMSLLSEHWAIPWSIFIAISLAQIHYADVVLKRSLWLLASVSTATLASIFIFRVSPGLPIVASTLGIASLMLSAPFLIRAVSLLVDRVFLHRADYVAAARDFEDSIRRM
ncbi:MAG: hypothetical protein ABW171_04695, partial [Steroidobacter sp.]